jgi:hypothetical protein
MKHLSKRNICCLSLLTLISAAWPMSAKAGGCAVSDGSELPTDDGCMLAFVYNQEGDHRLVVLDEKNHRRYEAPLDEPKKAPFWEGGKVYVLAISGRVQGFSIVSDRLVAGKEESLSAGLVLVAEYVRSQHRLYLIRSGYDDQRRVFHELLAIDFLSRKTLWTKPIDEAGLLRIRDSNISVTGEKLVQVFNSDTGEKIGGIETVKAAASADPNGRK